MKLSLRAVRSLAALISVPFLVCASSAIARADDGSSVPTGKTPADTVLTFHAGQVRAARAIPVRASHVQRCDVVRGELRCTENPVTLQGRAGRDGGVTGVVRVVR